MPVQIFCTISFAADEEKREEKRNGKVEEPYNDLPYDEEEQDEGDDESTAADIITFAGRCSLHGASHIFVEKGFGARQALWACAFLLSLSMFLYQVADRIAFYSEYHHVTTLDEQDSPLMDFPAVTICNFNRFQLSKLTKSDVVFAYDILGNINSSELGLKFADDPPNISRYYSTFDLFNRTCHQIEEMLLDCKYRGDKCGKDDFAVVHKAILDEKYILF
ncbi:acid-sensing ion channel 1B-like [Protopterus annectens]|uniref:acid-sensing ion channel 1B-like n=1 Tax=Protopterus annectens TaxID=7888 RepID=UPI001CFC28CE|nr:acid-sensing ion channel 1B-like [Protopterus annectens]